jgi:23S rRNA (uracil1939-C5)-methyltransferase
MMLRASEQPQHKLAVLREALLRTAKIDWSDRAISMITAPSPQGYRRRIRLQLVAGRIGFYARGSHQLVEPEQCRVSSPALNRGLAQLRQLTHLQPAALAGVRSLELREACDGTLSLYLEPDPDGVRPALELGEAGTLFQVCVGAAGAESEQLWQRFELTEHCYLLAPPGCFTQVHWHINRALIARVLAGAQARGAASFLDAYAGCGNFALPLLAAGLTGKAIESHPLAIRAAREAARRQALPAEGFLTGDSAALGRELLRQRQSFDLVLLDPPRAGVKHGLAELAQLARGWLVMCSCNPVTLARDLKALVEQGFTLEEIEAFDMFPETHHLETLVWLRAPAVAACAPAPT